MSDTRRHEWTDTKTGTPCSVGVGTWTAKALGSSFDDYAAPLPELVTRELLRLAAREKALAKVVAPLLPLFQEREENWRKSFRRADNPLPARPMPDKIALTAEFDVAALRALLEEG
jgi:hypothetical protein